MTGNVANGSGKKKTERNKNRAFVGPWFRIYSEELNNSRLQLLPVEVKWTWLCLSCVAARRNGRLPEHDQIAFELRMSSMLVETQIGALINAGLIEQKWDSGPTPYLVMTEWSQRQFVSDRSASRMRKLRHRKNGVTPSDRFGDVTCDGESDDNPVISSPLPLGKGSRYGGNSSQEEGKDSKVSDYVREGGSR